MATSGLAMDRTGIFTFTSSGGASWPSFLIPVVCLTTAWAEDQKEGQEGMEIEQKGPLDTTYAQSMSFQ